MIQVLSQAQWPRHARVRAAVTTRLGGASRGAFASFNIGAHCGDDPAAVDANRQQLCRELRLPAEPAWLRQVHGTQVVVVPLARTEPEADASWSAQAGAVCVIQTADCLPVLLADDAGTVVGAAHAGWRGLAGGVLEALVRSLPADPACLSAWLGPAIGPAAFEVGPEVRERFVADDAAAAAAFVAGAPGKFMADLFALARGRLRRAGILRTFGGADCTFSNPDRWYSFRRDARCGRMASLIWLGDAP